MFNHNSETKGHGSIRKNKVYGTIGVIALGAIAMFSNSKTVSADEASSSDPTASQPAAIDSRAAEGTQGASTVTIVPATPTSETPATYTAPASETTPATVASSASDTTPATVASSASDTTPATAASSASDTTPATAASSASDTTPVTYTAPAAAQAAPVASAEATEPKVTVENQKLKDAVSEAKGYNIDIKQNPTENIGTANNQIESDAKKDLANTLEETQATRIKTGVDAYKLDLKKAQENVGTDGYLSEVVSQGLKFESEPNGKLSISGATEFGQKDMPSAQSYEEYVKGGGTFGSTPKAPFTTRLSGGGSRFVIPKIENGQTITATYTNLQNSTYNGKKISKVVYEVTNISGSTGIVGFAEKDPTKGIYTFYKINAPSRYRVNIRFYDSDDNPIQFTKTNPAILAMTSLTKTEPTSGVRAGLKHEESITDYNFRPVKITGSLVEKQGDGRLAATRPTHDIKDDYDDPNFYKMGIAGVAESGDTISFVMQRKSQWDRGYWLALTSKLPSRFTLVKPDLEYNLVEYNLAGNVVLDNYIQGTTTKLTNTQTIKPTGTPVGEDYTTTHQDRITTADGKVYKYVSSTNNTTGKVKLGTINVANYYTEVKGNVVVDYQDKQGNTISPRIVDTPDTSVGTAYDTTDHKPSTITTADGASYRIDPTATQGQESGRVVEGTTRVIYVYDKLEKPVEKYGNVVVDYQDKQGNTISPRVVDTPTSRVGTYYDTTDHKPTTITADDGTTYRIDTNATQGQESGQVVEGTTRIVYVYDKVEKPVEKKYGDVTVEYKNKDGVTIAPKVTDTPRSEVGTAYDTTDQRKDTITTVDGKKYKLDSTATQGAETGKVVEGNTNIVYYYDLVKSPEEYGDVVVHYVDESGKKIKEDVTDTSRGKVGKDYDTTDHKSISIKHGNTVYNIVPEKTKGQERGKVVKGVTEVTYVYKAVQAEPKKLGTNAKGEDVNGKTMLAGSTEVYTINIDNDQYKGTTGLVDQDKQAGLMVVEKYDSKFVTPNLDAVRMTTEDGKVVSGFTTKIYKSVAEAPQKVQDYIKAKGLTIDGEFAVTTSDDPVAYTNNYALKGINLKLIFPTTVKKDIKEASKYENKAYQIDFAGIAETNVVTNNIPKINPKKDIVATVEDGLKDQNSLDGKTVKVGAVYNFELNTSYLPAKRGQSIDKIEVKDTYSPLVEYNGVHKWIANTDILLKDNTKIAKGTDLTRYVNQDIDHQARTVVYSFSSDFLSKISDDSEFQAIGYMQVKQLDYGTVKNTFTEIINNVEHDSNTVTVVTPEKPQTPPEKPQTPPVVPTTPRTNLPETGEKDHGEATVLGLAMMVSAMSLLGFSKRKEEK